MWSRGSTWNSWFCWTLKYRRIDEKHKGGHNLDLRGIFWTSLFYTPGRVWASPVYMAGG